VSVARIRIRGGAALHGAVTLPVDRAVAHVALVLAALAEGESRIAGDLSGPAFAPIVRALHALGVEIEVGRDATRILGRGLRGLAMPAAAIDCGTSRSTLALLAGALCAQHFGTRLLLEPQAAGELGDLVGALRARGANIAGSARAGEVLRAPISIAPLLPEEQLAGLQCTLERPDVDTKSAILLSGLLAGGATALSEPLLSADHTERMLLALGVPVRRLGSMVGFDPAQWTGKLEPFGEVGLPADRRFCAFVSAAAAVVPGSHVALHDAGMNPTRSGFFDAMRLLGAQLLVIAKGDRAGREPVAEVQVRGGQAKSPALRGGAMGGEIVLRCGDGLPALCLLGARAARGLQLHDGEPFAAPGDPIWTDLAALVSSFGAPCRAQEAGLQVTPATQLHAAQVDAREDHRLALTAVIFGLAAEGETLVQNAACIAEDGSDLLRALRELGALIEVERS
jgi:3-phosphoshikimate 1-carboxyvinyltransferase